MDGRVNNKGTKGHKGAGGRPTLIDEITRADVLNKSWSRILKKLDSKKVAEKIKDAIAFEIVKRSIPQKIDHSNNGGDFKSYSEEQINAIIQRHNTSRQNKSSE